MTVQAYPRPPAANGQTPPGVVADLAQVLGPVRGEHLIPQILNVCRSAELIPVEPARPAPDTRLSARELDVLRGMARDLTNYQIGRELYLSEDTVKTHARRLFRKLDVATRAGAVAWGFRHGVLS